MSSERERQEFAFQAAKEITITAIESELFGKFTDETAAAKATATFFNEILKSIEFPK